MTKEIKLSRNKVALVDDEDFEYINQWKWNCAGNGYAVRNILSYPNQKKIFMHRVVINTPDEMETDHINSNRLDNRKENLRSCTRLQNAHNRSKFKINNTGYIGVRWVKRSYQAVIMSNYKLFHLGTFNNPEEAAQAYDRKAIELHGEFAKLNFKRENYVTEVA